MPADRPHTTHHADCGCLTARHEAEVERLRAVEQAARGMRNHFELLLTALGHDSDGCLSVLASDPAYRAAVTAWRGLVTALDAVEEDR